MGLWLSRLQLSPLRRLRLGCGALTLYDRQNRRRCLGGCLDVEAFAVIELRGVRKTMGGVIVLHDVDLAVQPGECVVLTGDSGAGKTSASCG